MSTTPGHIELDRSIDSIRVGARHRTELGDIAALAASIKEHGLLQPITVTPDGILVCGARRLAALQQLGLKKTGVWVRAGLSDRLTQLLAEQDDNTLHKVLSPTEAASLYQEVKMLLAEDARRRQDASRFGSHEEKSRSDGGATVAPPWPIDGRSRTQAARLVTGRQSYTTLERIGELQRVADDASLNEDLRGQAARELEAINQGGSVASAHSRMSAQLATTELETAVAPAESDRKATDLERLAREAVARVKLETRARKARSAAPRDSKLPTKSFVFIWNDLSEWWVRYDYIEVASELTEQQWQQFEATLAGTNAFAERMRGLRTLPGVARAPATVSPIRASVRSSS